MAHYLVQGAGHMARYLVQKPWCGTNSPTNSYTRARARAHTHTHTHTHHAKKPMVRHELSHELPLAPRHTAGDILYPAEREVRRAGTGVVIARRGVQNTAAALLTCACVCVCVCACACVCVCVCVCVCTSSDVCVYAFRHTSSDARNTSVYEF
jgi:hypothetical protein